MALARDYLSDPTFAALLACWVRDRRAPLPLVDWLLERGLDGQAEGARWAATAPERTVWRHIYKSGPFPNAIGSEPYVEIFWDSPTSLGTADELPSGDIHDAVREYCSLVVHFDTIPLALCALLDGWADWLKGDCP